MGRTKTKLTKKYSLRNSDSYETGCEPRAKRLVVVHVQENHEGLVSLGRKAFTANYETWKKRSPTGRLG